MTGKLTRILTTTLAAWLLAFSSVGHANTVE